MKKSVAVLTATSVFEGIVAVGEWFLRTPTSFLVFSLTWKEQFLTNVLGVGFFAYLMGRSVRRVNGHGVSDDKVPKPLRVEWHTFDIRKGAKAT